MMTRGAACATGSSFAVRMTTRRAFRKNKQHQGRTSICPFMKYLTRYKCTLNILPPFRFFQI